jgi:hypothetical protein
MISVVAAVALTQGGYYAKLFPIPSGNNGYEEFVQAADIIDKAGDGVVWNPERLNLKASRELVDKYGRTTALIERGMNKPLVSPWDPVEQELTHAFLIIKMSTVAELMLNRIYVQLADGKPGQAAGSFNTALNFSDRSNSLDLIEGLSCASERWLILDHFEHLVHRLPLSGVLEIRKTLAGLAQKTPKIISARRAQLPASINEIDEFLNRERDPEEAEIPFQLLQLNRDQKALLKERVAAAMIEYQAQLDSMFAKEERYWHDVEFRDGDPLLKYLVGMMYAFPLAEAAVIDRTRLRIAALYCSIIEFKRNRNRFPISLNEMAAPEKFYDPASGEQFVYRKDSEQSFFIYSKGNEWTGPIHLGSSPWGEGQ